MQFPRRCTVLCMLVVPVVLDFNVVFCRYYYHYFFIFFCYHVMVNKDYHYLARQLTTLTQTSIVS